MSRKCVNNSDNFRYICGEVTFTSRKCSITSTTKKAYFLDFGCKVGDQDKKWAQHVCCTMCSSKRNAWVNRKRRRLPFGVSVVWRVPRNHSTDCYFCMVPPIQNYMSMKKKSTLEYPNIPSANGVCLIAMDFLFLNLRTILLYNLTMMTVFLQITKKNSHQLQEMQTTCKAQTPPIIRSQKASSMTSSGISNFQKISRNFGVKVTTV